MRGNRDYNSIHISMINNILFDAQQDIVNILKEDQVLSEIAILAENSKDIDFEIQNALGNTGKVAVVMTPQASYIGNYEDKTIVWELNDLTIQVVENVSVNRGKKDSLTGQDIAMRIIDWLSSPKYGRNGKFSPIGYEQGEDGNLLVNKITFKCVIQEDVEPEEKFTPESEPVAFKAVAGDVVNMILLGANNNNAPQLEYSMDKQNWEVFELNKDYPIKLNETLYIRAIDINETFNYSGYYNYFRFKGGLVEGSGNIMTLLDKTGKTKVVPAYGFTYLFGWATDQNNPDEDGLVSTPNLEFIEAVEQRGLLETFHECKKLYRASQLTNLSSVGTYALERMFCDDISLKHNIPKVLKPKTVNTNAYSKMFEGCTNITEAPKVLADNIKSYGCQQMFNGCASLTSMAEMPETIYLNNNYAFDSMYANCPSITEVYDLNISVDNSIPTATFRSTFQACNSITKNPRIIINNNSGNPVSAGISAFANTYSGCNLSATSYVLNINALTSYSMHGTFSGNDIQPVFLTDELSVSGSDSMYTAFQNNNLSSFTMPTIYLDANTRNLNRMLNNLNYTNSTAEYNGEIIIYKTNNITSSSSSPFCYAFYRRYYDGGVKDMYWTKPFKITIKDTNINGRYLFYYMFGPTNGKVHADVIIDMTSYASVPSLANSDNFNFNNTNVNYEILVPASLYDEWIQATNWSTIASHIKAV